jgi:hypothetical protein
MTFMLCSLVMLAGTVKLARSERSKATTAIFRMGVCGLMLLAAFLLAMLAKSYA